MKKIFTLGLGLLLAMSIFAADKRPTVTITSVKKYQLVIDGKVYLNSGNTLSVGNLFNGQHDIKVYKVRPGFFMSSKKLVASSNFQLRNNNVQINIDRFGQIQITESRFGYDWNDHGKGWAKGHDDNRKNDYSDQNHKGNHDRRF